MSDAYDQRQASTQLTGITVSVAGGSMMDRLATRFCFAPTRTSPSRIDAEKKRDEIIQGSKVGWLVAL